MKIWVVAILAAVVGAISVLGIARWYTVRHIDADLRSIYTAMSDKQEYTATISLAALIQLESGETDRAKLILAREVASYYRHPFGQSQAQRKKLISLIDST